MKRIVLVALLIISLFANEDCKLVANKKDLIYKVCGNKKELIPFNYKQFLHRPDRNSVEQVTVIILNDYNLNLKDEKYIIFDYKNMMVYDKDCLGGNSAGINPEDGKIYYFNNKKEDFILFQKEDLEHCKQPLEKWLKKPYKPL